MSSFSLVISPPDGSRPSFIDGLKPPVQELLQKRRETLSHHALLPRVAPLEARILSFGARLEPRYIFAAGQLV